MKLKDYHAARLKRLPDNSAGFLLSFKIIQFLSNISWTENAKLSPEITVLLFLSSYFPYFCKLNHNAKQLAINNLCL